MTVRPLKKTVVAFLACTFSLVSSAQQARIKIDLNRTIGDLDKNIYGNFVEHPGRCVYGGIYDPGSKLSDKNGFRKDVMAAVKELRPTNLRYPGGNFVSNYNWLDGVGPKSERIPRLELAWYILEPNTFQTGISLPTPFRRIPLYDKSKNHNVIAFTRKDSYEQKSFSPIAPGFVSIPGKSACTNSYPKYQC